MYLCICITDSKPGMSLSSGEIKPLKMYVFYSIHVYIIIC